jgi:uncharacterized protein (TIGR02453 family)
MTNHFSGFPREAFEFFRNLATHNNRDWFLAHKDVYERACREPMRVLASTLDPIGTARLARINRDMRFARDRAPYRTHISTGVDGFYISLSSQGLYVGTGIYKPEPAVLARLRAAIDRDSSGRALAAIVTSLRRKGYQVDTHESLTTAPKGYAAEHPRIGLLRMKDIYGGTLMATAPWLSTPTALARIKRVMSDVRPLRDWVRRNVGRR